MPSVINLMPTAPRSIAALVTLAAGAGAVVFALARFWGANPEHLDRLLILLAAGYAGWFAWHAEPALPTLPIRTARVGFVPLILGAVGYPIGWFLQAQVGPKPVVLWWLTGAWVLAAAGAILIHGGWPHLRRLAFPLGFLLFALPVPNRLLVPLQFALQSATTAVAAWTLPLLGVPVERSGFVLSLPGGDLGVAEACSGVRSVTALTSIAAFVAWWNEFRFVRGFVLVVLSVPVIAGVNAVRVIVSGLLQEYAGPDYVRGQWHEGLGIGMVLLGLGLIVGLAALLKPRVAAARSGALEPMEPAPLRVAATRFATILLVCSALATIAAQVLGTGAEQEVLAVAPLDQIPMQIGRWEGTDIPVPEEVAEMLTADAIVRRVYRDRELGYEVYAWVIFWSSRNMVKGYHHPDVCWPNRGFRLLNRDVQSVASGGGTVPITTREFSRDTKRQLVLYWTQEGRRVWSAEDEERVQATGDSHDWLGERLFRRGPPQATGRLVVLIGTEVWGDGSAIQKQTREFAAKLADEVYRICPWAAPPGGE
jgi:EpsI family protein